MPKVISKTDARQGVTPRVMRYVLAFGLILTILGFAAAWYFTKG
jgi:hypothetical protein